MVELGEGGGEVMRLVGVHLTSNHQPDAAFKRFVIFFFNLFCFLSFFFISFIHSLVHSFIFLLE